MKTKLSLLSLALIGAFSSSLFAASVAITYDFDSLRKNGGAVLTTSCVAIMVADSDGDGILPTATELAGISLTNGTIIGGTDETNGDRIFSASLTGSVAYGPPNLAGAITVDFTANGIETGGGTIWGLYWFPTISTLSTTLTVGTSYGFFHSAVADLAAAAVSGQSVTPMLFPADGGATAINVFYYDSKVVTDAGKTPTANTPTNGNFTASYSVIPEPTTLTLTALAALGLLRRRRA